MSQKIVLIDDDTYVIPFYIQAFELSQYEIRHFLSVDAFMRVISSESPATDLFIIDVMMSSGNYDLVKTENGLLTGLYVALDIRKAYLDVPIVLFSSSPLPPVTSKARSLAKKISKCSYVSKFEYPPEKLVGYIDYYFQKGRFKDGTLRKLLDSLILEPNLNGIGVDLKKLTNK
jgi:CheY-like chemotaxis protein